MAENVTLNPGSGGDTAAADDIGGVKFQRVKLTLGADGANDGDASSSNPVPTREPLLAAIPTTRAQVSINTTTLATVVAAVTSQTVRVHRMKLTVAGATTITIRRASTVLEVLTFAGSDIFVLPFDAFPWYVTGSNEAFTVQSSAAVTITGSVEYVQSV